MSTYLERNPYRMAAIGLALCVLFVVAVFQADRLPLVGGSGTHYRAAFLDAGGLKAGDAVEVAGVQVGTVNEVEIETDHIVVAFDLNAKLHVGGRSTAAVKIGDLLGTKFLDVTLVGRDALPEGSEIPLSRTEEAYDVVTAVADLTEVQEDLDTDVMAKSMQTLADTFRDSPKEVSGALEGISDLSRTVNSRDEEIRSLLKHANATTGVLSNRRSDLVKLVKEGNQLMEALLDRKKAIHRLLVNTSAVAKQLEGLARDNQAQMRPALTELNKVLVLLNQHQADLSLTIKNMAGYAKIFNNTVASGPWFDSWVPNTPDSVQVGGLE